MRLSLSTILITCCLVGCDRATPVSVLNQSGATLRDVVVSGNGFDQRLGDIAQGVTATTQVRPKGESGLKLSFQSGHRLVTLPAGGYFEGGGRYAVTVVVTPDLGAAVSSTLRPY